jgi:hypothetical protein
MSPQTSERQPRILHDAEMTDWANGRFRAHYKRGLLREQFADHPRKLVATELAGVGADVEQEQCGATSVDVTQFRGHLTGKKARLPYPARWFLDVIAESLVVDMKGPLACRLSEVVTASLSEPEVVARSFEEWREGSRNTAGVAPVHDVKLATRGV